MSAGDMKDRRVSHESYRGSMAVKYCQYRLCHLFDHQSSFFPGPTAYSFRFDVCLFHRTNRLKCKEAVIVQSSTKPD